MPSWRDCCLVAALFWVSVASRTYPHLFITDLGSLVLFPPPRPFLVWALLLPPSLLHLSALPLSARPSLPATAFVWVGPPAQLLLDALSLPVVAAAFALSFVSCRDRGLWLRCRSSGFPMAWPAHFVTFSSHCPSSLGRFRCFAISFVHSASFFNQ